MVNTGWVLRDLGQYHPAPRRPQASGEEEWYFPLSLRTKTVFPNMSLPEPQSLSMMATVQDQYCSYWIECRHSIGRDMAWHELPPLMVGLEVGKFCEREQNYFRLPLYSPMVKLQHEFWPFRWIQKVGKFCEREQNYFWLPLCSPMVRLQHEFWSFKWFKKVGKFCEQEQNYFRLPLYRSMVKLKHEFWSFKWFKKLGKFCEREQNYFRLSLHVGKDSF